MNDIESIRIDAWTDGNSNGFALHIARKDGAPGLHRVWFVLSPEELGDLISGRVSEFVDGYHRLSLLGETATFYDFEMPRGDAGVAQIPFFRVDLPRAFWKLCFRIARFAWRQQARRAGGWRLLPDPTRAAARSGSRRAVPTAVRSRSRSARDGRVRASARGEPK